MDKLITKHVWALTGGVASGKSTVEQMFRKLGAIIIDADQIAKELLMQGSPYLAQFFSHFENIIKTNLQGEDGSLNRALLRQLMAENNTLRSELETFMHPLIQQESFKKIKTYWDANKECLKELVIYSAALIFEKKREADFKGVIWVNASAKIQKQRLIIRDKISSELAEKMIQIQSQDKDREKKSNFVIKNDGDLLQLQSQVQKIYEQIKL